MSQINDESTKIEFRIAFASTALSRSGPQQRFSFLELKRMLAGRKLGFVEEVIAKIEAYFEAKGKSY